MIYTHLVLVRSLTTYKECNMDKKEYDEFIINFNQHEMFADSAISVRDYGDRMVIVDKHARNGVISFKTAKNKELAAKIRDENYEMTTDDLIVNEGAILKNQYGERRFLIEKAIIIPAKYDYNYRVKYESGYIGPVSEIPENHSLDSTRFYTYENTWQNYHDEYGKVDDMNTAMVYYGGKQYLIYGESGNMYQDGFARCRVNNTRFVLGSYGWEVYGTNEAPDIPGPVYRVMHFYREYITR